VGQPVELSPLAKRRKDDPRKVEQFQVILAGSEIGNGYSELNDPFDQESRFERQMELKEQGDVEAQDHDKEFIDALKYGMPPACGFGVSERLFAALMNRPLRECVVFPLMKPDNVSSDNDTKQAVLILNKDAKMEPWEKMNTLAHLGASFAARKGRSLLSCEAMETKDKHKIKLDIQHAILIKEGDTKSIAELISTVKNTNLELVEFIREMIDFASDKQLIGAVNNKNYKDIKYLGILVFGKIKEVDKLTKNFRLVK
jgi:lysyl-tRNA synthetase class 2